VPRAERAQVPLLVAGNEILWVIGWRVDGRHAITADTNQVLIVRLQPKE